MKLWKNNHKENLPFGSLVPSDILKKNRTKNKNAKSHFFFTKKSIISLYINIIEAKKYNKILMTS